jgi:hypothetical protein
MSVTIDRSIIDLIDFVLTHDPEPKTAHSKSELVESALRMYFGSKESDSCAVTAASKAYKNRYKKKHPSLERFYAAKEA